jgi:gliding motility-associated-like protein
MLHRTFVNSFGFLFFLFFCSLSKAQLNLSYALNLIPEQCTKGSAVLSIGGSQEKDSVVIKWSTGEENVKTISNLSGGEHSVRVFVKRISNKTSLIKDTLFFYTLEKIECDIQVSRFFTPNNDLYNDVLSISNINSYPNFELEIYNKWGQRVHSQKKTYTPWDGKWLGVDLPDGSYFFVLFYDANDKSKLIKGDITLLR